MPEKKIVIAIDGVAASGKSTTAKIVAQKLDYLYLDSGALYRAVTLKILQKGIELSDESLVGKVAEQITIQLISAGEITRVILENKDVTVDIRSLEVTESIGPVAANPKVRAAMPRRQRELGKYGGVVADGRDIGTVVFPDAELKFFFTASLSERAKRRAIEYRQQRITMDVNHLADQLEKRDLNDASRDYGPLLKAEDAIELDTSDLKIDAQVDFVLKKANEIIKNI